MPICDSQHRHSDPAGDNRGGIRFRSWKSCRESSGTLRWRLGEIVRWRLCGGSIAEWRTGSAVDVWQSYYGDKT